MRNFFALPGFLMAVALLTLTSSCKSDLDINAPYKDTPVVYGILNQNDTAHYVKITKAFLGQADAYQMAQVKDSSEYGDILDVKIIEELNGSVSRTFNLERILLNDKSPGVFYGPDFYIYKFITPTQPLNFNAIYKLLAINKKSGKEISSETDIIHPFTIDKPSTIPQSTISFAAFNHISDMIIEWTSAENARRYSLLVVFNYKEVDKSSGNAATYDTTSRKIEWIYNLKSKTTQGGEKMIYKMTAHEFYNKIGEKIPPATDNIERLVYSMDFHFIVAGEELNTYMEVNEPVTGIVQEKPEYTNIVNGIGIFSSRYDQSVLNKGFNANTAKYLKNGEFTTGRGFIKYWEPVNDQYLCIELNSSTNSCN